MIAAKTESAEKERSGDRGTGTVTVGEAVAIGRGTAAKREEAATGRIGRESLSEIAEIEIAWNRPRTELLEGVAPEEAMTAIAVIVAIERIERIAVIAVIAESGTMREAAGSAMGIEATESIETAVESVAEATKRGE